MTNEWSCIRAGVCGFLAVVVLACSTPSRAVNTQAAPAPWRGDTLLAPILNVPTLGPAQIAASDVLATQLAGTFDERVADVAMDSTAPALIRSNAVLLLSDRRVRDLDAYSAAFEAADERVRASVVVAMRPFLNSWRSALGFVKAALQDPSPLVQSKALEALSDSDPVALRAYATRASEPALRKIALDLVQTAEDRGAPLVPSDSTGSLERVTSSGHVLRFRPTTQWPAWSAAVGELSIAAPGQSGVVVSNVVEVVNHVLPAFVSVDGKYLVYEANRQIHVRDLSTATERIIGAGIAPRLLPFTDSFVFLRPKQVQPTPTGSTIRYDVLRSRLADSTELVLGQISAQAQHQSHGHYSPVRWVRVQETDGSFVLAGEIAAPFRLPDPFTK